MTIRGTKRKVSITLTEGVYILASKVAEQRGESFSAWINRVALSAALTEGAAASDDPELLELEAMQDEAEYEAAEHPQAGAA